MWEAGVIQTCSRALEISDQLSKDTNILVRNVKETQIMIIEVCEGFLSAKFEMQICIVNSPTSFDSVASSIDIPQMDMCAHDLR